MEDATITTTTAVPPLDAAAASLRRCEIEEWEAQRRYQDVKTRMHRGRANVRQLVLQETMSKTLPEAVRVRAERRALEQAQTTLDAELGTLDGARRQANTRLLAARCQHALVVEAASAAWRSLRQAQVE